MGKSFRNKEKKLSPTLGGNMLDDMIKDNPSSEKPKTTLKKPDNFRKTFLVNPNIWESLLNFIHTKRKSGDYLYSQEKALDEALGLLFETVEKIESRPQKIKDLEESRSDNIKRGINKD